MQWYGSFYRNINFKPTRINTRRRINLKARTLALDIRPKTSYKDSNASVFFPVTCKYTFLQNKFTPNIVTINLLYSIYYSNLFFQRDKVEFFNCSRARSIFFYFPVPNNYFNLYWLAFSFVFHIVTQTLFHKIKFRGKGYYVYKNYRNVLAFQFGYAHRVKIYVPFLNVKFLSKTSVFLFGLNKWDIMKASNWFFDKRPINVFTGRGVRFTRQVIYRKAGKMSTYR